MSPRSLQAATVGYSTPPNPGGRRLFSEVDLRIEPGDVVGITGANGEGKTSLIRILAGLLRPVEGAVLLDGHPIAAMPALERARAVAYLPQSESVPIPITAMQMALLGRYCRLTGWRFRESRADLAAAEDALRATGVYHLRRTLFQALSGGERMRVRLARVMAQEPRIYLLDEPTTYLDADFRETLAGWVRVEAGRGASAVVVSHDMDFLRDACTRSYELAAGRLRRLQTYPKLHSP